MSHISIDLLGIGTSNMAKSPLKKTLRVTPQAKRHGAVIKETLKALEALSAAGVVGSGYKLTQPYSKKPIGGATNRKLPKVKMTYCA
jgi:hypothetical protein